MRIFFGSKDRKEYLRLLGKYGRLHGMHFAGYVLMDNHIHFIGVPEREDSLRRAIGEAHRQYTRAINRRMKKKGYLFQGRPYSCPLDDDHCLAALLYVERNPVRARMVPQPWDYQWSGARYHVGLVDKDPLIDIDYLASRQLSTKEWREFLQSDPSQMRNIRKSTKSGRPCGDKAFVRRLEEVTGRVLQRRRPGPRSRS